MIDILLMPYFLGAAWFHGFLYGEFRADGHSLKIWPHYAVFVLVAALWPAVVIGVWLWAWGSWLGRRARHD